jgi:hypothetical protein
MQFQFHTLHDDDSDAVVVVVVVVVIMPSEVFLLLLLLVGFTRDYLCGTEKNNLKQN